jgi:predicted peptidase
MRLSPTLLLTLAVVLSTNQGFALAADDPPRPAQQPKVFEKEVITRMKLEYLLFLPEGYETSEKEYPLILFLHGAGESGSGLERIKKHGMPKVLETRRDLPFIVVSPQSLGRGWNPEALNALLDRIILDYRVDRDRVYLTGLSMGGYGTWALAAEHPERFAAIAPICGGGNPANASKLKDLPIWVFHGAKDPTVPLSQSQIMVDALKAVGSSVKFTIYPDAVHDSWTETYDNPELFAWLLSHKRGGSRP